MSDNEETAEGSSPRRGVLEWLSDLFTDDPTDRSGLMEILRDAADRQLMDGEALNIIFGALQVSDMQARDIMIPRSQLIYLEDNQSPETQ